MCSPQVPPLAGVRRTLDWHVKCSLSGKAARPGCHSMRAFTHWRNLMGTRFACMLVLLLVLSSPVLADQIDQSFISGGGSMSGIFNGCCSWIAQTFTAGMTGNLTGVNLNIRLNQSTYPMQVEIRTMTAGLPSSTVLGSTVVPAGQGAPLSFLISFPQAIAVLGGTEYAIVVHFQGTSWGSYIGGSWSGGTGNPYLLGDSYGSPDNSYWTTLGPGNDFNFQTHMNPVPEPTSLLLLGSGLCLLASRIRCVSH